MSYEFKLSSDKLAKRLWKTAVEHHTFFRSVVLPGLFFY